MGKNINFVKIFLGALGLLRIFSLFWSGQPFLLPDGPLPSAFVYGMSSEIIFKYIPHSVVQSLPYWRGSSDFLLIIHAFLLIFLMVNLKSKIFIPVLIIFEYSLYTRTSFLVHAGDSLFLSALILFLINEWLPERLKEIFSFIWVSQGILLYFYSGIYKDTDLWLINGTAIHDFSDYYLRLAGENPPHWGSLGVLLSRMTYLLEIAVSSYLFLILMGNFKIRMITFYASFAVFGLIHISSAFIFHLNTLPWICIAYLVGMIQNFKKAKSVHFIPKLSIFGILLCFHLFPFLGLNMFPFDFFPLRQQWSLFSKVPPARIGSVSAKLIIDNSEAHIYEFDESFQWRRYQEYLVEEYPQSQKLRKYFAEYVCHTPGAIKIIWSTPYGETPYNCKED